MVEPVIASAWVGFLAAVSAFLLTAALRALSGIEAIDTRLAAEFVGLWAGFAMLDLLRSDTRW